MGQFIDDDRKSRRIRQLRDDGYIIVRNGCWQLTDKGWAVLYAHAEPKTTKPRTLTKDEHAKGANEATDQRGIKR